MTQSHSDTPPPFLIKADRGDVGHWAIHRQPGFQLRLDVEPRDLVVIIHLHGTEGVLSCLLELWLLPKLPLPQPPQEKHG